jgi:hypothetical protein
MLIYCCELYTTQNDARPVVAFPILIIIIKREEDKEDKKTKKTQQKRR